MDAEQLCFDESPVPPSQPLEELSPPPIAFDTIVWVHNVPWSILSYILSVLSLYSPEPRRGQTFGRQYHYVSRFTCAL